VQNSFFSIIIPTFNSEKTLQNALNSIISQDFTDWDVLIVDGISKDGTMDIIKKNHENDLRINFISEADKGIYDAMNKGINLVSGRWLYFLGSDDFLFDNYVLSAMSRVIEISAFDFYYGNVYSPKLKGLYGDQYDIKKILFKNISHQAVFYNRSIYNKLGFFNIDYSSYADWDFNIRCFENSEIMGKYVNLTIANFAEGGTSTVNPDIFFLRKSLLKRNLLYLNQVGIKTLTNIKTYDNWWRLIRSLKINKNENPYELIVNEKIPAPIITMILCQKKISQWLIINGYFSKSVMLFNYIKFVLKNIIRN
jgi:glycosyltransferase involved in cell wall biosynthesis